VNVAEVHVAGAVTLAGVGCAGASLAVLHVLPTGLSPLRNAVSQYGINRYRTGYRVQTISFAVAGAGAAVGLATALHGTGSVVALLGIFAAARLVISWYPMDVPGGQRTRTGRTHLALAVVTFAAIVAAGLRLAGILARTSQWPADQRGFTVLGWLLLVAVVLTVLAGGGRALGGYFGAAERLLYAAFAAWLALVGTLLVTAAR